MVEDIKERNRTNFLVVKCLSNVSRSNRGYCIVLTSNDVTVGDIVEYVSGEETVHGIVQAVHSEADNKDLYNWVNALPGVEGRKVIKVWHRFPKRN